MFREIGVLVEIGHDRIVIVEVVNEAIDVLVVLDNDEDIIKEDNSLKESRIGIEPTRINLCT